jgi:hypothetical protein
MAGLACWASFESKSVIPDLFTGLSSAMGHVPAATLRRIVTAMELAYSATAK